MLDYQKGKISRESIDDNIIKQQQAFSNDILVLFDRKNPKHFYRFTQIIIKIFQRLSKYVNIGKG